MTFEKAMECLKTGEKIKRSHWKNAFLFMENQRLKMTYKGWSKSWHYSPKNTDLFAKDWLIAINHSYED